MKYLFPVLLALVNTLSAIAKQYDVCIYGGTSAGIVAAKAVAESGKTVLIVEPSRHLGGLTTGGLGQTDMGRNQQLQGIARQFYRDIGIHYGEQEKIVFEPKVATAVFARYLSHPKIHVMSSCGLKRVHKRGGRIIALTVATLDENCQFTARSSRIRAKVFIDASYEGDLMALAGVSFTTGRESADTYGESWNGAHLAKYHQFPDGVDPYVVPGDPSSGLLWGISSADAPESGCGDTLIQAYNLRLCLTDSTANSLPLSEPSHYDASRYELLARLIQAQKPTAKYFIWSPMPGRKTDVNNYGGFSTDLIGGNLNYLEATYAQRKQIYNEHSEYIKGLLWFMMTDPRVPNSLSQEISRWGRPLDEYPGNDHWTPQLYVREGRRMLGDYVVTQADCEHRTTAPDGIAEAAYMMDSHNCQRIVIHKNGKAMVKNEGDVEIEIPGPYPISYRAIVPKRGECTNLIVPVCLSASHIAYGSVRMEPVFMTLGEVSARAAVLAIQRKIPVQDVDWKEISLMAKK